jgi:hypothetical protein
VSVCVSVCVCLRVCVCVCVHTAVTLVAVSLTLVLFHTQRTLKIARLVPVGESPVSDVVGIGIRYVCLLGGWKLILRPNVVPVL